MSELDNLKKKYLKKLDSLGPSGLALSARILSTISLHRDMDQNIFRDNVPSDYMNGLFEKQFLFLEYNLDLIKTLKIREGDFEANPIGSEHKRDSLHIDLFNSTWKTLKLESDPLNNYKKWIDIIKGRLELNNLDKAFFQGKNCIDIGCGTGRFSFCMADMGANVWGIDPGAESISVATELANQMNIKRCNFSVQNAYSLNFDDKFFNFATCNGVLHHLDDPVKALKEIYRVLAEDGKFWLYIEGSGGVYHEIWDLIFSSFENIPFKKTFEMCNSLNISDVHFWMDRFYAKYHLVSFEENEKRLQEIGFRDIQRMKSSEMFDMNVDMFSDDKNAKIKFGDGGIRILISK
jgi:ubiquinone/menaquinone biosynthesis C-methylase UbiE